MSAPVTEKHINFSKGISCYLVNSSEKPRGDSQDLQVYLERFKHYLEASSIYEKLLLINSKKGDNILSIGEGTGEFVVSLAVKYPHLNFFAFDYMPERVAIAQRLIDSIKLTNAMVYIGSVEWLPFSKKFFSGVIERGVFHILPRRLKVSNLTEIEKVCRGRVVMSHMSNAKLYIAKRWLQSKIYKNRKVWKDAIDTYRVIDRDCDNLKKMARLVREVTGHRVEILYHFKGDQELSYPLKRFSFKEYLGGITYCTND